MDEAGTLFYLDPINKPALDVVQDPANRERKCLNLDIAPHPCLRIGLDQPLKTPLHLVRFGRRKHNDVILNRCFSRNDQCFFDFNKKTGELILHDISEKNDTELYDVSSEGERGHAKIWKTPRQCVVILSPESSSDPNKSSDRIYMLKMRQAKFRLIARGAHGEGEAMSIQKKLAFAGQPDPEQTQEGTIQRLITLSLQSLKSEALTTRHMPPSTTTYNPHNTRFITRLEPEEDNVIRYTKLGLLGAGAQGEVHKVVDMYNGDHHACKIVAVKAEVPMLGIHSEKEFRVRVAEEVDLVRELEHDHIVPYIHIQGFKISQNVEIFIPIYEGSLSQLIASCKEPTEMRDKTESMFSQILCALDFVHTQDPPIVHRDIKPANILYRGNHFLLTDFGIAKFVDTFRTQVGTRWYMAPEVLQNGEQTPKVDIYGLGVTIAECMEKLQPEAERESVWHNWQKWKHWHQYLVAVLAQHAQQQVSMLAFSPDQRPTAGELLRHIRTTYSPHQNLPADIAQSSFGVSPPTNQACGTTAVYSTTPTPMDLTGTGDTAVFGGNPQSIHHNEHTQPSQPGARPGSVSSTRSAGKRQGKRHKRARPSCSGRPTLSRPA